MSLPPPPPGARMPPARSDNPRLDALLRKAHDLHPTEIDLTLGRLERLLGALGNPHHRLPPVFHVAGTNGKGSTCAMLRACLEAEGRRVHVYSSPHLVRFNERIRLAGQLIDDDALIVLLNDVIKRNGEAPITFFELTTAAAFLAFATVEADAYIIEVGLGGRMDATNIIPSALVSGIAQLGLDHTQWLGPTILDIAREKAGIARKGVPLVTGRHPAAVTARIAEVAGLAGAKLLIRGQDWDAATYEGQLHYRDEAGKLAVSLPRLAGIHQHDNAALAIAMLRAQTALPVKDAAYRAGMGWVEWPARLQKLESGPLWSLLPAGSSLWVDGGHNPAAGRALAESVRPLLQTGQRLLLVTGMLVAKDAEGFLKSFAGMASALYAVPVPGHAAHDPAQLAATASAMGMAAVTAPDLTKALRAIARNSESPPLVLVTGSLHLAGRALELNGNLPN
ncbi:bifunctional folylpolyglutamate synthase/dihydrofolate synthase [Sandarakinorhabdus limnophila]|uniref:bifunctional folylpolyglutamate synthase/dihydrofolate synthase n=1 Tax=Sandarakinorhabdus limnophila TaxID=210512 RepID=UPI0026F28B8B|nr:folylpolyglutamate synthase/dihydrofolate synthase family protein [Sandarakinorhabdus limnophila]